MKKVGFLRYIIFFVSLAISLLCFVVYSHIWVMLNTVYYSQEVTNKQSDELKEMIGMGQFEGIFIRSYRYEDIIGKDVIRGFSFNITIPFEELEEFMDFMNKEEEQEFVDSTNAHIHLIKEPTENSHNLSYEAEIFCTLYNGWNVASYLIKYGVRNDCYQGAYLLLILILLVFVNTLIIFPYHIYRKDCKSVE